MDTNMFRRFLAVVEHGSVNRAAQALNVSQPALSKSIQQLEEHYGVPLLHRGAQGVVPTEFGVYLMSRYRLLQNELEHLEEEMAARARDAGRSIHIGVPPGLGFVTRTLGHCIARLAASSTLSINVRIGSRHDLLSALQTGDLALLFGELGPEEGSEGLTEELLTLDEHVFAIRSDHPLGTHPAVTLDEMMSYPLAIGGGSDALERRFLALYAARQRTPSVLRSESSLFIANLLVNSDYVGLVAADTLKLGMMSGQFRLFWPVAEDGIPEQPQRRIGVTYRGADTLTFAASKLLREVRIEAGARNG